MKPEPHMTTVFEYGGSNLHNGAKTSSLIQVDQSQDTGALFAVTYGLRQKKNLTYSQAARELGVCIFHHLACESILNNQGL